MSEWGHHEAERSDSYTIVIVTADSRVRYT